LILTTQPAARTAARNLSATEIPLCIRQSVLLCAKTKCIGTDSDPDFNLACLGLFGVGSQQNVGKPQQHSYVMPLASIPAL